ncbi:HET-domain-containing protein [Xylariaceae sp. FL1651]|nr:HET-domain-containing protein [Xylariaceae sp. FL1651]
MTSTYRDLIRAIPPLLNLSNIAKSPPCQPCSACAKLIPDRHIAKSGVIKTEYELFDTFPDFPVLGASNRAGCTLCGLIRKIIRSSWAVALRPMEEEGIGTITDKDGIWDELLDMEWDCKVRLYHAHFYLQKRGASQDSSPSPDRGSLGLSEFVQLLGLRFGPATLPLEADGRELRRPIYQEVQFKVFDSADNYENLAEDQNIVGSRAIPDTHTLSKRNIALIQGWIHECKTLHTVCQLGDTPSWLPTRLLYLVRPNQNEKLNIQLVESKDLVQSDNAGKSSAPSFLALSHMWGDTSRLPPLRTLKSNYASMKRGISLWDLPQNFWDAVRVCECLGFQYLWIDSLCIVQDSPEDWKHEAGTMHLVYKHAQATIVAAAATSSRDGFLIRQTRMTPAVKIAYASSSSTASSSSSTEPARPSMVLYPYSEEGQASFAYADTPWNTRGWTFQERFLSSRLVYFCRNSLQFECRRGRHTEEGEYGALALSAASVQQPAQSLWPRGAPLPPEMWSRLWCDAVQKYTLRRLTFPRDKLVAIQSIANEMMSSITTTTTAAASAIPFALDPAPVSSSPPPPPPPSSSPSSTQPREVGEYIGFAGMWANNLRIELLWRPWNGLPTRTPEYRAPSWSWAALDCGVTFPTRAARTGRWYGDEVEVLRFGEQYPRQHQQQQQQQQAGLDGNTDNIRNYIRLRGHTRKIASIFERDRSDLWAVIDNGGFPFSLEMTTGDSEKKTDDYDGGGGGDGNDNGAAREVFAHAYLDMDNSDSLIDTVGPTADFIYLHISNSCEPSGMILKQTRRLPSSLSSSVGYGPSIAAGTTNVWSRVGVATVFRDLSGARITEKPFEKAETMQSLVLI